MAAAFQGHAECCALVELQSKSHSAIADVLLFRWLLTQCAVVWSHESGLTLCCGADWVMLMGLVNVCPHSLSTVFLDFLTAEK